MRPLCLALACALASPCLLRAEPVTLDYRWSVTPAHYGWYDGHSFSYGPTEDVRLESSPDGLTHSLHYPGGRLDLHLAPPGSVSVEAGSQLGIPVPLPFATVSMSGSGANGPQQSADFVFGLGLTVTDRASGQSASFASPSNLLTNANQPVGPSLVWVTVPGLLTPDDVLGSSARLGDFVYEFYVPDRDEERIWPFQDGASPALSFGVAAYRAEAGDPGGAVQKTPEPSSLLLLGGVGLALSGLAWVRRRRL